MKSFTSILSLLCIILLFSCSTSQNHICGDSGAVEIRPTISFIYENKERFSEHRETLEEILSNTISKINSVMTIDELCISIVEGPRHIIPEIGIGGFNPGPNEVILAFDLDFQNITTSIEIELPPLIAHEVHHAMRRRTVGYGGTLLEAMISEGLADHFSLEVFDVEPPQWSTALDDSELTLWINEAAEIWSNPGYNHNEWFFGAGSQVPRWAGYSIGYKLVADYLAQNMSESASSLVNESARSFLP